MATARPSTGAARSRRALLPAVLVVATLVAAAVVLALVLDDGSEKTSAVQGSGVAATDVRELPPFTAVELAGANDVRIGVGGEQRVVVRGDDNLVAIVTTQVSDGTLVLDQTEPFSSSTPLSVEITVPSLERAILAGAGTMTVDGHDLETLALTLSGSGTIGGAGSAQELVVDLSGSGDVELDTLVAEAATVTLSGTGNVQVHATRSLDALVSGAGTIAYSGDPQDVRSAVTGTGAVSER
jgi:Putative auto-transporter adhesin, head GIN domain